MSEYHKISTVYARDPKTKFKTLLMGEFARPEFEYLAHNEWRGSEKIDGTNVRVYWDGEKVRFAGRTDRAQMPEHLIAYLESKFYWGALSQVFDSGETVLYGEGCGLKIQKGGENYNPDGAEFVLFDVRIGDWWLRREDVEGIAKQLQVKFAPEVFFGDLYNAVYKCEAGFDSQWGDFQAEGLVLRPATELLDRSGRRIITKIKCRDFQNVGA